MNDSPAERGGWPSHGFRYDGDRGLYCEDVPVGEIAAAMGTPLYIYSRSAILRGLDAFRSAFAEAGPLLCYSVKANSNLHICRLLAGADAGFDVVSGGELYRVIAAGGDPGRTVFAGVGKTSDEIHYALESGVFMFNVESSGELEAIAAAARETGKKPTVAVRVNPDVAVDTHAHITTGTRENKFGLDFGSAAAVIERLESEDRVTLGGLHVHIGSQIRETAPYAAAVDKLVDFCDRRGLGPERVPCFNVGGGFGISYDGSPGADAADFAAAIVPRVRQAGRRLILEPGRYVVGNAGIMVTRVTYVKRTAARKFLICDAGMNDLIRPLLYDAYHHIWPVAGPASPLMGGTGKNGLERADVVGPICESADYFARDRELPNAAAGDLLAVFTTGAYGMAMSSVYNSRPRPCEVLVDGRTFATIRRRESYEDLLSAER